MSTKRIQDMDPQEYRAYVKRLERRHGPAKRWEELPIIRRPGRPAKGSTGGALQPHSVKVPPEAWKKLAQAAKRHRLTPSGVLAGLAVQAVAEEDIDRTIDRLIKRGILTPA